MSITRINEFNAAEGKSDQLFAFLKSLIPFITSSDGCTSCQLLRQQDDPNCFVVIEQWLSEACHQASIANFPQEQMQAAMPLFGSAPQGRYFHV